MRCPAPRGSFSPVCPLGCVALLVRCPGPLGSCSPVCPLGSLCCVCGVLGHLAPHHRCARFVLCFACAVSWATWLLFTGVPVWFVVLLCVCGVLGHLAPVHRCAPSLGCVARAVSWATWLLFTGVPAPWVVLRVRCPGHLGSCSPVCSLGVLCWVCGVSGHVAPFHRCACSMCFALDCACGFSCGASLRGTHSSIRTAAVRSRQRLGTLWGRTRSSGRRLFVAGRGSVRCRARTHPSGRRLLVAGKGWVPSGRALVRPDSGWCCLAPVLVPSLLPAACLSGVPHGPACCAAARTVPSLSVLRSAFPTPWCLSPPQGLALPALLGGCAGHAEAGREAG